MFSPVQIWTLACLRGLEEQIAVNWTQLLSVCLTVAYHQSRSRTIVCVMLISAALTVSYARAQQSDDEQHAVSPARHSFALQRCACSMPATLRPGTQDQSA